MRIARLGLFGNPHKQEIGGAVAEVARRCREAGVSVMTTADLAVHDPDLVATPEPELPDACQAIIAFGGDGTMLRAARTIGHRGTPLLGINLGSLGYLTDVPLTEMDECLDCLLRGDFSLVERSRVACAVQRGGEVVAEHEALNDLVVNMGPLPRALEMEVRIDQVTMGRFVGDGLIVATPTGSTAYNLSAGGPIVHPAVSGLLVTPICPHSLAVRPLLLPDDRHVELRLYDVGQGATLTADGQAACPVFRDDRIRYRLSDHPVRLIKFPRSDFFRAMRHKFQWGAIKRRRHRS